ncbi:MAG: pyridoxal phosphate-dependent aminotransferase [Candidatus Omnitrophica bacterium]|nr:pyridoxal phosphate-dependent aminotransferase [Candidatus Omnitrophota bacterium]
MRFSEKNRWRTSTNRISEKLGVLRNRGRRVLDLTESNPTRCGFRYLGPGLLKPLADAANLVYEPDCLGLPEARAAVCRYYAEHGVTVHPKRVFLTASTSESYDHLFRLFCDPLDGILVPEPSYPLLSYLAEFSGARLEPYPLRYRQGRWGVDLERFQEALSQGSRAVVIVNPNNPTGNFMTSEETKAIQTLCRSKNIPVIADEVFLDYGWGSDRPQSLADSKEVLTFTLSGVSKVLGLPQMKLSWMVLSGPEDLTGEARERLEVIADTFLSVNTPAQRAFPDWMAKRGEIRAEILGRLRENHQALLAVFGTDGPVRVLEAQGGWYAVLESQSSLTDEEIVLRLLENEGVLVHPGYLFDFPAGNFLVLSLLPPPALFQEGIQKLFAALRSS